MATTRSYAVNAVPSGQALAAAARAATIFQDLILQELSDHLSDNPVQSNPEAIFLGWWLAMKRAKLSASEDWYHLDLLQQREIQLGKKHYRLDFVVLPDDGDELWEAHKLGIDFPNIAVEIDGHYFHDRTHEQVNKRNSRDRDLQIAGWRVFHFSETEIAQDPEKCVLEVMEHGSLEYFQFQRLIVDKKRADKIPPFDKEPSCNSAPAPCSESLTSSTALTPTTEP